MADTKTINYELIKQDVALPVRIAPINANMDIIDVELKKNADAAKAAQSAAESAQSAAKNAQTAADTANAAIGDIATLLDAINGEVI